MGRADEMIDTKESAYDEPTNESNTQTMIDASKVRRISFEQKGQYGTQRQSLFSLGNGNKYSSSPVDSIHDR